MSKAALRSAGLLVALASCVAGCQSDLASAPVFGAVFGLDGAAVTPFTTGKIPERPARSGDAVIGSAANNPGLCIWRDRNNRRFRADCPEGYSN